MSTWAGWTRETCLVSCTAHPHTLTPSIFFSGIWLKFRIWPKYKNLHFKIMSFEMTTWSKFCKITLIFRHSKSKSQILKPPLVWNIVHSHSLWTATPSAALPPTGAEGSFRPAFCCMLLIDYSYFSEQWPLLIIIANKTLLKIRCLESFSSQNYWEGNRCLSSAESYAQWSLNSCSEVFSTFT